jgi:hypothetical protein
VTAAELLEQLDRLEIAVELDGPDHLLLMPSPPAELIPELRAAKAELLALVAARSAAWSDPTPTRPSPPPLTDPRPDLPDDSADWTRLLALAGAIPPAVLAGTLHGFRCCGARLTYERGHWRFTPTIDPTERVGLWQTREAWERDREKWLLPFRRQILGVLAQLPPPTAGGHPRPDLGAAHLWAGMSPAQVIEAVAHPEPPDAPPQPPPGRPR